MTILTSKDFIEKYTLKNNAMYDSDLQRVYNFNKYPRNSKIYSDGRLVNIDNGSQGGTHWICFIVKDNKSYYCDSFGAQPENFSLNQLPKPVIYHKYKIQHLNSKLCGSYCLYYSYLIEKMNH